MRKLISNSQKAWSGLAASAALVLTGAGCSPTVTPVPATPLKLDPTPTPAPITASQPASAYKDGTFTVDASYVSPGGADKLDVMLTVKGGVVAEASLTEGASNPKSQEYQDAFAAAYKPFVVGKRLDQLQLDRVAGASLTTAAFNSALKQIEAQTKL